MPTEPLQDILYRELAKVAVEQAFSIAPQLLQELVNYGTCALVRCATSVSDKRDEDIAILALYRHTIEMTDGIEVLVSQGCATPAIPLLRSAFEALLSLKYIVEIDQDYHQRSLSWLVGYIHERLDMYERLDPTTPKGQVARKLIDADDVTSNIAFPLQADLQKYRANLQALLAESHLQPIETEFQRCKKTNRSTIRWHQLFGGPKTLYKLAEHLNKGGLYETLYRSWSTTIHSQNLLPFIGRTPEGEATIASLRDPNLIVEVVRFATPVMLEATQAILKKLRPGEDEFERWFEREVQALYLSIVAAQHALEATAPSGAG